MKIIEKISKSKFESLKNCEENYFSNGCIFAYYDGKIIAFPFYSSKYGKLTEFYKVLNTN